MKRLASHAGWAALSIGGAFGVHVDGWLARMFHENVRIGFIAHARIFQEAIDQGLVLAPAKSMAEMQRIVFIDYIDAALAGFFMLVVLSML